MATKKKSAAKKKAIAKVVKKQAVKKAIAKQVRSVKHEIVVHVDSSPMRPTETDLSQPMKDGKELTLQKTWIGENQLLKMLQRTPREQVYRRKGKGQADFEYVTGSYCTKWLNFVFGWNWDWEIVQHGKEGGQVWALGKLTVRGNKPGQMIVKTGFGRSDVKQLKAGGNLDYGNDLKAASTDAMKKAASLLGFASDIYGKADYKAETGIAPLPAPQGGGYDKVEYPEEAPQRHPQEPTVAQGAPEFEDHICQSNVKGGCGRDLTKAEAAYSKRLYGRELCKDHYPHNK